MAKGKFNLNQILSDTSRAAAGGGATKPRPAESEIKKISVFDLVPSEDNFYSMREIEELKVAIEIAGKVLQNLVVVPLDGGKYKVIAGHRRRLASIALVQEGKPQYEFVTCSVEPNEDAAEDQEIRDGLNLIVTNSQREKTAWDKIEEVRYLRDVLEKAKRNPRFVAVLQKIVATVFHGEEVQADGTRDFIAKVLHTSPAQIGRYDAIIRNLCPAFMEELKEDRINVSTAYELSGLSEEEQKAAFAEYQRTGEISIKAARGRKPQAAPPAQTEQPPEKHEAPKIAFCEERETGANVPAAEQPDPAPEKERWTTAPGRTWGNTAETPPAPPERPEAKETPAAAEDKPPEREPDTGSNEPPAAEAPKQPDPAEETRCIDGGICPHCREKFDAAEAVNYNTLGTQVSGPVNCPHCGKLIEIFCSVEYFCSPAEE